MRYKLFSGRSGRGVSLNISTGGMLFRADAALSKGELIQVELDWPPRPDTAQPMRLVLHGFVIRSDSNGTAMTIAKYELRVD